MQLSFCFLETLILWEMSTKKLRKAQRSDSEAGWGKKAWVPFLPCSSRSGAIKYINFIPKAQLLFNL